MHFPPLGLKDIVCFELQILFEAANFGDYNLYGRGVVPDIIVIFTHALLVCIAALITRNSAEVCGATAGCAADARRRPVKLTRRSQIGWCIY